MSPPSFPIRRAALFEHSPSIEKLRAANGEQIAEVPGFGGKKASELHTFLKA